MPTQLTLAEARRRGPRIAVLPDGARVEERLRYLARQRGFVPFRIAFSLAELGRELIREAQRAGSCPEVASRFAVQLALRQAARDHSPGPYFAIRNHAGYARALGDLLAALSEGLLEPEELAALDVGGRALALGRTLAAARDALGRVGLADPHRALRLAVEHVERGGPRPRERADAAALEFDCVLDWTPLRLRLAKALATRLRVRIRLPWSGGRSDLTDLLEPTLRAIEKLAEPAPELELFAPAEQAPALAPFLRRLFAADGPPADAPAELPCCARPGWRAPAVAGARRRARRSDGAPRAAGQRGAPRASSAGNLARARRGAARAARALGPLAKAARPRAGGCRPCPGTRRCQRARAGSGGGARARAGVRRPRRGGDAHRRGADGEEGVRAASLADSRRGVAAARRRPWRRRAADGAARAPRKELRSSRAHRARRRRAARASAARSAALRRGAPRDQPRSEAHSVSRGLRVWRTGPAASASGGRAAALSPGALRCPPLGHAALAPLRRAGARRLALAVRGRGGAGPRQGAVGRAAPADPSGAGLRGCVRPARARCPRRVRGARLPGHATGGSRCGAGVGGGARGLAPWAALAPDRPRRGRGTRAGARFHRRDRARTLLRPALRGRPAARAARLCLRPGLSALRASARGPRHLRVPDAGKAPAAHRSRRSRRRRARPARARHAAPPLPRAFLPPDAGRAASSAARRARGDRRPARGRVGGDGRVRHRRARRPPGLVGAQAGRAARGSRRGGRGGAGGAARRARAPVRVRGPGLVAPAPPRRGARARHRGPDRSVARRHAARHRLQVEPHRLAQPAAQARGAARARVPAPALRRNAAAARAFRPSRRRVPLAQGRPAHEDPARERGRPRGAPARRRRPGSGRADARGPVP